jgi:hydroxymethylpyrimidine pyrophosphatase-like HAD family hydrolase/adenine/guanine phosphoribosyltransferase-like PRPP-binding protein
MGQPGLGRIPDDRAKPVHRDEPFYSLYTWCLNPVLRLADILAHLREEASRYHSHLLSWQREEACINLFLLLAAACCTMDDFLDHRARSMAHAARSFPRFARMLTLAETALNAPDTLVKAVAAKRLRRQRAELAGQIDRISNFLISGAPAEEQVGDLFRDVHQGLAEAAKLPSVLLDWRMRIPEGFRCQDMAHQDGVAMADRFLESCPPEAGPALVIGLRTAGAYLAPLVSARLTASGFPTLGWVTIRPKEGLRARQKRSIRKLIARAGRVVVVDDHPNTGNTLALTARLLQRLGADPSSIVILVPEHDAQPDWKRSIPDLASAALPYSDLYKRRLLDDDDALLDLLRPFYRDEGWQRIAIEHSPEVEAANRRLTAHYADGFQVRLKRVLEIRCFAPDGSSAIKRIFAKSVGWGWLGYHAYLAGSRLEEFCPQVIGLRKGILFTHWIGPLDSSGAAPRTEEILETLPSYLAARTRRLGLNENSAAAAMGYRWTGWNTLAQALRRPYGPYIGRLKTNAIRAHLRQYLTPMPTLPDGRMKHEDWIADDAGLFKIDFEQHNFGGGEQDLVDTAFDLASAGFELELSEKDERKLACDYMAASGDVTFLQRLPLYKILCGTLAVKSAVYHLVRDASSEKRELWNRQYCQGTDYLTFELNRYCAGRLTAPEPARWTPRLVFMDLDGVLDWDHLGFAHTTPSGLIALATLKQNGYSVVLNTGRPVNHVRSYCRTYGLPGGAAEYGSVFVDAVRGTEIPLIDGDTRLQLIECRRRLEELPGVFTDPRYEQAVRAYRFKNHLTIGLHKSEIDEVLAKFGFDRLKCLSRYSDSCFTQKDVNKGTALEAVKQYTKTAEPVTAIGDSAPDLEMLRAADIAYMPANCAQVLRNLGGPPKYRVMRNRFQRGLLEATRNLVRTQSGTVSVPDGLLSAGPNHLIDALLSASERSPFATALSALSWTRL